MSARAETVAVKQAHTPGPWYVCGNLGASIGARVNGKPMDIAWTSRRVGGNATADAALIAAAPDLLASLRETTSALHAACMVITDGPARAIALSMVKDARTVIAKATA
jgi:hypothetical protein